MKKIKTYWIDLFCGAGGTTTGIHLSSVNTEVIACVNHDSEAKKCHKTKINKGDIISIPVGMKHRVKNTGAEDLSIIEVQMGEYFGEDDILRYSDKYGRDVVN